MKKYYCFYHFKVFCNVIPNSQEKPISIDRMLVKSKPMKKLCEYEGRGLPENVKSDCWNDVDETEYACSVGILKDLD